MTSTERKFPFDRGILMGAERDCLRTTRLREGIKVPD
jgi:hypothetical protein